MAAINIQFPMFQVDANNQLEIVIRVLNGETSETWNTVEKQMIITDMSELEFGFELDESLIAHGTFKIDVTDINQELGAWIFMQPFDRAVADPYITIDLLLNGSVIFSGYLLEDTASYDYETKVLSLEFASQIAKLYEASLIDGDGNYTNPFGYADNVLIPFDDFLLEVFQVALPYITLSNINIVNDWSFRANDGTTDYNGDINSLYVISQRVYRTNAIVSQNLGELMKNLARSWGYIIGLERNEQLIFEPAFNYDAGNLQSLGRILKRRKFYQYDFVSYYEASCSGSDPASPKSSLGDYSELDGRSVKSTQDFYFYADQSYSVFALSNTVGRNVRYAIAPLVSGSHQNSVYIEANYWHKFMGNLGNLIIEEFVVEGVDYTLRKFFVDGGVKYRPFKISRDFKKAVTTIKAFQYWQ